MQWLKQQNDAINAVSKWLNDRHAPQVFRLFGYAGSGKTTLAKHLAEGVHGTVRYACFTGKAALVLKKKGCAGASTIHSLIYKPETDPLTGEAKFNWNPDSGAADAALIVVDEVSMVGEDLARDLLRYGVKVLVLGDPAQLPPVKGEGFFINAKPDVMLTDIHRQAADNPIIRMSMDIREGRGLGFGEYGDSIVVRRTDVDREWLQEQVTGADQLLCGLNRTRQAYNLRIREMKGLVDLCDDIAPVPGDRLVCLRNNRDKGLLNGGLWEVQTCEAGPRGASFKMRVQSLDEPDAAPLDVETLREFFSGTEKDVHWTRRRDYDEFTFGWALTVHKAQGSQYDDVIVFDESRVFREDADKWLYTAVTRAAENVTVVV